MKKLIKEHEHLVKVLKTGTVAQQHHEARKQAEELAEMKNEKAMKKLKKGMRG